jgi:hypothetical protein
MFTFYTSTTRESRTSARRRCCAAMMESKSDGDDSDGDGVQPIVVVPQRLCHIETTPASF